MSLNSIIDILSQKRGVNLVLLVIYYLSVVLPHEIVGIWIAQSFEGVTRGRYDLTILVVFILCLLVFTGILIKKMQSCPKELSYMLMLTLVFIAFCFHFLFVLNVEAIHFIQYGIFAILAYPLFLNYSQTMLLGTLAGVADEAYQYLYLAPLRTEYYDFNDVVINQIGLGLGLIFLRSHKISHLRQNFFKSRIFKAAYILFFVLISLYLTNIFSIHPSEGSIFSLIRVEQPGFWSIVHPSIVFHVVKPLEGVVLAVFLTWFYSRLDRL